MGRHFVRPEGLARAPRRRAEGPGDEVRRAQGKAAAPELREILMIRLICLISLICMAPAAAQQQEQLFEFKGVPLAASEEQFRKVHADFVCSDVEADAKALGDRVCHTSYRTAFTYGGVPVKIVTAYFYSDRLSSVNISIEERHFLALS